MAPREVVVGAEEYELRVDLIAAPAIVLPEAAYYLGATDFPNGFTYALLQRGAASFAVVTEPVTQADALRLLLRVHTAVAPGAADVLQASLRYAVVTQCAPTPKTLGALSGMRTVVEGVPLGAFLSLPGARDAEWTGDRALSLSLRPRTGAALQACLWGRRPNGWRVPEMAAGPSGRKRKRHPR